MDQTFPNRVRARDMSDHRHQARRSLAPWNWSRKVISERPSADRICAPSPYWRSVCGRCLALGHQLHCDVAQQHHDAAPFVSNQAHRIGQFPRPRRTRCPTHPPAGSARASAPTPGRGRQDRPWSARHARPLASHPQRSASSSRRHAPMSPGFTAFSFTRLSCRRR